VKSLQASKSASRDIAKAKIKTSQIKFLGSLAGAGSKFAEGEALKDKGSGFVSPGNPHT
jgi:hypothetical protein